jgi:transposase-like protein
VILSNEVECDEAYVVAGHKGQPEVVKSKERKGRRRRLKGKGGRGTMEKERPPVFGMMERGGQVVINLLANVKQKTIEPLIKDTIDPGTLVYTDEYNIYARLQSWGYSHKSVNHGRGEFARDEDGDGLCEVHVNTMEGFWSLLRSWLRPHRGISQEKLPLYRGSLSLFTMCESGVKRCWARSLSYSSQKTPESNKSVCSFDKFSPMKYRHNIHTFSG